MTQRFITLEGGEGAGKTTLAMSLQDALREEGYEVVVTREPGGCLLAEQIRHWLLDQDKEALAIESEVLLFLAARAQHVHQLIKPALHAGKVVICDRFIDSTIAYQVAARGLPYELVKEMSLFASHQLHPSLTFLLDLPVEIGLKRARARGKDNRFDAASVQFHETVRQAFLTAAASDSERIVVLDATESPDKILSEAKKVLQWHQAFKN